MSVTIKGGNRKRTYRLLTAAAFRIVNVPLEDGGFIKHSSRVAMAIVAGMAAKVEDGLVL